MTYQPYLDGHIIISEPLLHELPTFMSVLTIATLIPILTILLFIVVYKHFNDKETGSK